MYMLTLLPKRAQPSAYPCTKPNQHRQPRSPLRKFRLRRKHRRRKFRPWRMLTGVAQTRARARKKACVP